MENHFLGHKQAVYSLQSDGFGGWYSAGSDGWIVHWPDSNKTEGVLLAQAKEPIYRLFVFGPNSEFVLAGGQSGTVYAFRIIKDFDLFHSKTDTLGSANVQFIESHEVAESKKVKMVQLWIQRIHSKGVFDFVVLSNNWIASCSADGHVAIWDFENPELGMLKSSGLTGSLRCFCRIEFMNVKLDPAQTGLMPVAEISMGGYEGKVYKLQLVYSLETGEPCKLNWMDSESTAVGLNTLFQCVSFPNGFVLAGRDAKLWYTNVQFNVVKKIDAHWFSIHALAISPDGRFLVSGSMDKTIRIWDLITGELLIHKELAHRSSVNQIVWLNELQFVSCSDDAQIISWKIEN